VSDFNYDILNNVAHRPWPMSQGPWLMTQSWHDLLFAHWPVAINELRKMIPNSFELDLFQGEPWVGIVAFHMTNVSGRGMPALPWVSAFPELNLRTYVRVADKPGVYFFSLDAGSRPAVAAARTLLNLPYFFASMSVESRNNVIRYDSRRDANSIAAEFVAEYKPVGPTFEPPAGSIEHFLTERYCLYALDHGDHPYRLDIHHSPWRLQQAEAELGRNTMAEAASIRLPSMAPLLHFAGRQDAVAWAPTAILR
jgi:hypothetical protein